MAGPYGVAAGTSPAVGDGPNNDYVDALDGVFRATEGDYC
jgi:hypothetical protein